MAGAGQRPRLRHVRRIGGDRAHVLLAARGPASQARLDREGHARGRAAGTRRIRTIRCSPGQTGEIYARGDNISPGYLDDPEATADKFPDGMFRTGDLATVDADGYMYVLDRKDDFIKSWGHRVSSQEIEAAVLTHPDLVSAAAVGVPDQDAGEAIWLFVTVNPSAGVTVDQVVAHCRRIAAQATPAQAGPHPG